MPRRGRARAACGGALAPSRKHGRVQASGCWRARRQCGSPASGAALPRGLESAHQRRTGAHSARLQPLALCRLEDGAEEEQLRHVAHPRVEDAVSCSERGTRPVRSRVGVAPPLDVAALRRLEGLFEIVAAEQRLLAEDDKVGRLGEAPRLAQSRGARGASSLGERLALSEKLGDSRRNSETRTGSENVCSARRAHTREISADLG